MHGMEGLSLPAGIKMDMWPKYQGPFVRRPPERESADAAVPDLEAVAGRWGLVSAFTKRESLADALKLSTFNSRTDRVTRSFTFGNAWRRGQHCIIPAECVFEPDYRTPDGKPRPARVSRADGEPMGIAGIWDAWTDAKGERQLSYTMLTINAAEHPLMRNYHRPGDEKRTVVILPEAQYDAWLDAPVERSMEFMQLYPAEHLVGVTAP